MNSEYIHSFLNRMGIDLFRFRPGYDYMSRKPSLERIFKGPDVNLVLDIGANKGQFGKYIRRLGFTGRIVSFEPLHSAFDALEAVAGEDPNWEAKKFAVGEFDGVSTINVSSNSVSSSLLPMLQAHADAAPGSEYVDQHEVEIRRLDSVFDEFAHGEQHIYLKIDTQGGESRVLEGATDSLKKINTIQVELSLTPLYEGQLLFAEMYGLLEQHGYELFSMDPGFFDRRNGRLLQVDGFFRR